jgi:hypothetical protein
MKKSTAEDAEVRRGRKRKNAKRKKEINFGEAGLAPRLKIHFLFFPLRSSASSAVHLLPRCLR